MKSILNDCVERIRCGRQRYHRYVAVLLVLSVCTALGVNWGLHQNGVSMTADYQCGKEAHEHTSKCYTQMLVCSKEETDGSEGHTHSEVCRDENGELICGLEESTALKEHHHTDSCYENKLTCGKEEHRHTIACMADEAADVETASDWENTLPEEMSGIWADDLAAVAKSQIGYQESTKNFRLAEDGETKMGYTRYGAWYGNAYGGWSTMFAAFCLHYAGISTESVPVNSGCKAWIVDLKEADLYQTADRYEPKIGDIVFLDTENDDGEADRTGIIEEVKTDENGILTGFYAVVGDSSDAVERVEYERNSESVIGYGVLPEKSEADDNDVKSDDPSFTYEETMSDGTVICVEAPEGAFPDGIQLNLETKNALDYLEAIRKFTGDEELTADGWLAYDFDFYTDEDHHGIEPSTNIKVTFSNLKNLAESMGEATDTRSADSNEVSLAASAEESCNENEVKSTAESDGVAVYHIADTEDGEVTQTTVSSVDIEAGTVEIETDTFSTQLLAPGPGGRPGGNKTSVDHIDIGISATASVTVNGNTYNVNVGLDDSDFTSNNVTISAAQNGVSVSCSPDFTDLEESSGTSGISQVRVGGTYPVGTLSNPVVYTFTLEKEVEMTIEGQTVTVPLKLSESFHYFQADNDCPGIHNKENLNGTVSDASGLDFVLKFDIKLILINKEVVDEDGNLLKVSDYTADFTVDQSVDDKGLTVVVDETTGKGFGIEQVNSIESVTLTEAQPTQTVKVNGETYNYVKTEIDGTEGLEKTKTNAGSFTVKNVYSLQKQNIKIIKHKQDDETTLLPGAKFTLTRVTDDGKTLYYSTDGTSSETEVILTTDQNGEIAINNLKSGNYYITETEAPSGYDKLTNPILIVISGDGVKYGDTDVIQNGDCYEIRIADSPIYVLPDTGGTGIKQFTTAGIVLTGAALLYGYSLRRRRERRGE